MDGKREHCWVLFKCNSLYTTSVWRVTLSAFLTRNANFCTHTHTHTPATYMQIYLYVYISPYGTGIEIAAESASAHAFHSINFINVNHRNVLALVGRPNCWRFWSLCVKLHRINIVGSRLGEWGPDKANTSWPRMRAVSWQGAHKSEKRLSGLPIGCPFIIKEIIFICYKAGEII